MKLRLFAIMLLVAMILVGCAPEEESPAISQEEIVQIIAEDMEIEESEVTNVHAHMALNGETPVYNVYFSAGGKSYLYVLNAVSGEILSATESAPHSH